MLLSLSQILCELKCSSQSRQACHIPFSYFLSRPRADTIAHIQLEPVHIPSAPSCFHSTQNLEQRRSSWPCPSNFAYLPLNSGAGKQHVVVSLTFRYDRHR